MIWTKVLVLLILLSAPSVGGVARTHRLQVVHADGELPQRQQQVQLRAQKRDVAHLQESEHQPQHRTHLHAEKRAGAVAA